MDSSSVSGSSITSSSRATNEVYLDYRRAQVGPRILADLEKCESCDVDQLLAVFLNSCRATDPPIDPPTPHIAQSPNESNNSFPSSTATENPSGNSSEATTDPTSSAPDPGAVDIHPVSRELFDSCLQKVIPICSNREIRELIQNYQQSLKEKARYQPFVVFANHILTLLKTLQLPGLRDASPLEILFQTNDRKRISGKGGSLREPDVVVVSLASAKRARKNFHGGWQECAVNASREAFDWPDLLISGEMKWHFSMLYFQQPTTYHALLKRSIEPLPTYANEVGFAKIRSNLSDSNSNATSSTSISSLSAPSGSTYDYVSPSTGSGNSEAAPNTPNERKRSAEDSGEDSMGPVPKRGKADLNHKTKENILDAVEKSGINGAEMLRCSLGRRHALAIIIIDATVWIWWYDRQGAIQSTGINFIEDLPRFMVFLFAIQRFDLADWGFDEKLDPSILLRHYSNTPPTPQPVEYEVDGETGKLTVGFTSNMEELLYELFNLKGKATNVFGVTGIPGQSLVAKLSWPNQDRPHEADIIERARKDLRLSNHLPYVHGRRVIDPTGTRRIRDELGISPNSPRLPRLLLIIVFEELFPITMLKGDSLVFAWLECLRSHYLLWERHIRHLDLSLGNLMLRRGIDKGKQKYFGVLNDWDLGDAEEKLVEPRKNLMKTILFTSLDLLKSRPLEGQVVQRYSHDLESFAWILVWVFLAVRHGEVEPVARAVGWQTCDPVISCEKRQSFVFVPWDYTPHEEWHRHWPLARRIAKWLHNHIRVEPPVPDDVFYENETFDENEAFNENEASDQDETSGQDETPAERKELLRSFLEVVKERYRDHMPSTPEIEGL